MKGNVEDMKRDTGWRMLKGYKVYVEDGKVYRDSLPDSWKDIPICGRMQKTERYARTVSL